MPRWQDEASAALGVFLGYHTPEEAHGPCPECGGTDRFIVWSHGKAWCRQCHYSVYWLQGEDRGKAQRKTQAERLRRIRRAVWEVSEGRHLWISYHERCLQSDEAKEAWGQSGIGLAEIKKWGLGWSDKCPSCESSSSLVIPVFRGGMLVDIRHRLTSPPEDSGKYRSEFPGLMPYVFNADVIPGGRFVLVEGEKKAIVLDSIGVPVAGVPGVETGLRDLLSYIGRAGALAIVAFDPGAEEAAARVSSALIGTGGTVWVADFPDKPDDFLI